MESRKDEIIEAAYNVLIDYGIEGLSLSKVGSYADVPKSLIFHYFTNKDALISAVVEYVLKKLDLNVQNCLYLSGKLDDQVFSDYLDVLFDIDFGDKRLIEAYYACNYLAMRNDAFKDKLRDSLNYERYNMKLNLIAFADAGIIEKKNIDFAIDYIITTSAGIASVADVENGLESVSEELLELHKNHIKKILKRE